MEQGRMIVLTGAPGTGKTTAAALLAAQSDRKRSVHLHTDDLYHGLVKGALPPYLPGADEQNLVVIEAFLAAAKRFAWGGYEVIVDGIVGPWFLEPWLRTAEEGVEVHYLVLRAGKEETLRRAIGRAAGDPAFNAGLVEAMWAQFQDLGDYEAYALDTTRLSVSGTVAAIRKRIAAGRALLRR